MPIINGVDISPNLERKVGMYDLETGNLLRTFNNCGEAGKFSSLSDSEVAARCRGEQRPQCKRGYAFKYIVDEVPEFYMINNSRVPIYKGSLNYKRMPKKSPQLKAYSSFCDQVQRTTNPNRPFFKQYGARGICVKYKMREFISWFLCEFDKRKDWHCATVNRMDNDGNYCFENIELIEKSDNSKERIERAGNPGSAAKPVTVTNLNTGKQSVFFSIENAAKNFGVCATSIRNWCGSGRHKKIKSCTFSFEMIEE